MTGFFEVFNPGYRHLQEQRDLEKVLVVDQKKGVRVAVGDRIGLRNQLVRDLVVLHRVHPADEPAHIQAPNPIAISPARWTGPGAPWRYRTARRST